MIIEIKDSNLEDFFTGIEQSMTIIAKAVTVIAERVSDITVNKLPIASVVMNSIAPGIASGRGIFADHVPNINSADENGSVRKESEEQKTQEAEQKQQSPYTIEDVRSVIAEIAKDNGTKAAKEFLKVFNADKVTDIKEDDYVAVMEAVGRFK